MISKKNCREIIKSAEENLLQLVGEKRACHTLAVTRLAEYLAEYFKRCGADIDVEEVRCAALLHDAAKYMDAGELCSKYGIELSEEDIDSPSTIHAITGAYYAREEYKVPDSVFSAILKHTVGNIEMSLMDNIIFVSDYCEETRTHKECIDTRNKLLKITEMNQGSALLYLEYIKCEILFKTINHLSGKGEKIHPGTIFTLKSVLEKNNTSEEFLTLISEYRGMAEKFGLLQQR